MLAAGACALHGATALAGVGDGLLLSERTQLVEPPAEVSRVARDYKAVFFKGMPRPAGGYDVEHTSLVYLVDRQGRFRATFQGAGSEEIASLTRAVMQEKH